MQHPETTTIALIFRVFFNGNRDYLHAIDTFPEF